jgi:type VI secretion system FHA domain protein
MIVLRVLSYNGAPADGPAAQFDELGGTLGRADNNQLVLPDPERTISRVHARIVFRAGAYAIVDSGSNPISHNGLPVGAGREQTLKAGDQVQIGAYVLSVSVAAAAPAEGDPFADLFGDGGLGLAAPASHTVPPSTRAPAVGTTAAWPPPASAPAPAAPAYGLAATARSPGQIPDDWDPFAPDEVPGQALRQAPAALPGEAFNDLPAAHGESLDDLFDLGGTPRGGDPLGGSAAQALLAQPNMAQHSDALESLARTATVMPPSQSDHFSDLNTPMPLPASRAPAALAPTPSPLPAGAVFSWDDPPRDGRVVTLPAGRLAEAEAAPLQSPPRPRSLAPAGNAATAVAPSSDDALLAGLLEGLDTPGLRLNLLTPEIMRLIGQLLRESMRGTVELLVARSALKREMRAELTMIVSRSNNPLKFSPTVEVALQHLLSPPAPGFMPAAPAVRDAFDDLRAHQLGVMAGMRAALEGVLQRFDPQQLESKLTKKSAIASLIPATRKARLWELFQDLFAQLQTEAQDDFDELFGKAFLRAYEDQLERLRGEPGPR